MGRVPRRALAFGAAAAILLAGGAFAWLSRGEAPAPPQRTAAERPTLMLVTSLPLVFGEQFSLEGGGSKALAALETRYRVEPIAVTDSKQLAPGRLLLMAHPLAQPAEALVDLDRWVRSGGRLLLLADPMLEWESSRPLGDKLRPPPAFADTGLLAHWGLRLHAPGERGPREHGIGAHRVLTASPGSLEGKCSIHSELVARCRIGEGRATVIADADFLNVEGPGALDGPTHGNLPFLLAELQRLER